MQVSFIDCTMTVRLPVWCSSNISKQSIFDRILPLGGGGLLQQLWRFPTVVRRTGQLQARGYFTFILLEAVSHLFC
jgi:hypothetical protein